MTANDLAQQLCKEMVRGVYRRGDREFIVTRFSYPVGDSVNLYLTPDGRLSDQGTTHYMLSVGGIDLTEARRDFIYHVCALYGVEFDSRILTKRIGNNVGADVLAFCEAITRISTLEYDARSRKKSTLSREVDTLVATKVEPRRPVIRNWTEDAADPNRAHVVDYHFNTTANSRNMYVVTSGQRAETVSNIIRFWATRYTTRSIAVVDAELQLPEKTLDRLLMASDRVVRGVAGHEEEIVNFALSTK